MKQCSVVVLGLHLAGCAAAMAQAPEPDGGVNQVVVDSGVQLFPDGGGDVQVRAPRVVYRDATGSIVAWDIMLYTDAKGFNWGLDAESAGIASALHLSNQVSYSGVGCTGSAYVSLAVRWPVKVLDETVYRVRPDTLKSQVFQALSTKMTNQPCYNYAASTAFRGELLSEVPQDSSIQEPSLPFVAPIRQGRE